MPVLEPIFARVAGDIVLRGLPPKTLERLGMKLSFANPKYASAVRMNRHPGAEPERIEAMVVMPDGSAHVPRGAIEVVNAALERDGFKMRVDDDARSLGSPLAYLEGVEFPGLRDYQAEGVAKLLNRLQGMIVLPCGCGKTRLGVGLVVAANVTALIMVPTQDLADQWADSLRELAGIECGIVGDGKRQSNADVVVAIVDSLLPLLEANPAWGRRFGLAIVDEAHHAPCSTFQRALTLLPARLRCGLTATDYREDGTTDLMRWSFGPTLLERETNEMIKLKWLTPAEIEIVQTGWRFEWDGDQESPKRIVAMEKELAEDLSRNAMIADRVAADGLAGESVLVLCGRRGHTKELASMIEARGCPAVALTGKTAKKKRKATIANLRAGVLPVMLATSLADEGLDIQRLSRLHLAAPQRARGRTTQRLGRLLRNWPGKKPKLVDYVDDDVPTLADRASARKRVYREAGLLRGSQ